MPRFSIIAPIYNLSDCLSEMLASVIEQDYVDWELICVDDGSTDDSGTILDEYAAKDRRIVPVHVANGGVSKARNIGIEYAKGDWLMFLDGDDILHSLALKVISEAISRHGDCDIVRFEKQSFFSGACHWSEKTSLCADETIIDLETSIPNSLFPAYMWQYCYLRTRYDDMRFNVEIKYNMGEDDVFLLQALDRARKCCIIDAILYGYRQRSLSAMHLFKTPLKWKYDLMHYIKVFEVIETSTKIYDRGIIKEQTLRLTESMSNVLKSMDDSARSEHWQNLLNAYDRMRVFKKISWWNRFVLSTVSFTKSKFVFMLLCSFPYWLKRKGLHRRSK